MTISFSDFMKIEIRVGTIMRAEVFERAKNPSYKVWVDFGEELGVKKTSAQITVHYRPEDLPGKMVCGLVNVGERNIAGFMSEFLLLGFSDSDGAIVLATPEKKVPNGNKLH